MTAPRSDEEDARAIVRAVKQGAGELVGSLSVARAMGGFRLRTRAQQQRAVRRVYDLMPLAVELSVAMCPGQVLMVNPDRTYRMISELDPAAKKTIRQRLRKVLTAEARVSRELSVGGTEAERALAAVVGQRTGMANAIEYLFRQMEREDANGS